MAKTDANPPMMPFTDQYQLSMAQLNAAGDIAVVASGGKNPQAELAQLLRLQMLAQAKHIA